MSAHPDYWRIKAAYLSHQLAVKEAQAAVEASRVSLASVLATSGLMADKNYRLNDADQTITEESQ